MSKGDWTKLLRVEECRPGRGKFVCIGDHELAVFHLADPDRFIVTRNSCPHAGGNLSAATPEGSVVTCPWHHWEFDLATGRCTESERVMLRLYESRVEEGFLYARLPDERTIPDMAPPG